MNDKFGKIVLGSSVVVSVLIILFVISQENPEIFASAQAKKCSELFAPKAYIISSPTENIKSLDPSVELNLRYNWCYSTVDDWRNLNSRNQDVIEFMEKTGDLQKEIEMEKQWNEQHRESYEQSLNL